MFSDKESVFDNFAKANDEDIVICFANYEYEDYSGYASVFYYRNSTKKFYENYGSHCSCFGLEGQWEGDEVVVFEELEKRFPSGL